MTPTTAQTQAAANLDTDHSLGRGPSDGAILAGWVVLRITHPMVDDGRALRLVERAFRWQRD